MGPVELLTYSIQSDVYVRQPTSKAAVSWTTGEGKRVGGSKCDVGV
jgi:hypothetical protein